MSAPLLKVDDLAVEFGPTRQARCAWSTASASRSRPASAVGIVGESGSGKSITSLSILRLIPEPPGRIVAGPRSSSNGVDLLDLPRVAMPEIRGRDIAMIFQEPMSSLNPVMTIGDQIGEAHLLHEPSAAEARRPRVVELLELVGIPTPSGGSTPIRTSSPAACASG